MKYKILEILEKKNEYISGEELAEKFNVSRTAIWKAINKLKEEGYLINSVTNKGYYLDDNLDIINQYEATENLKTKYIGQKCIYMEETGSTNDDAKKMANDGVEDGTVVLSQKQTSGKGRLGRKWESPQNGLYFSIILKPDILPQDAPKLTLLAGIAIVKAIRRLTGLKAKIKWPNDIIINGKKFVGILTEMSAEIEQVKYVVTGIGINVNNKNFSDEIEYKTTSLYLQSGKNIKRKEIYYAVLEEFENLYEKFLKNNSFAPFVDEYRKLCLTIGLRVRVIGRNSEIIGVAEDIEDNGSLIIKKDDGEKISVFSGEVSIRREDGKYI